MKEVILEYVNPSASDMTAVSYCEEKYPEMTKAFKDIQQQQYALFCKKQKNYGPNNISVGTSLATEEDKKLSLTGIWFRVNDKIQRYKELVLNNQNDEVGESIDDTISDMSIYGIIALIVRANKWGK